MYTHTCAYIMHVYIYIYIHNNDDNDNNNDNSNDNEHIHIYIYIYIYICIHVSEDLLAQRHAALAGRPEARAPPHNVYVSRY